MASRSQLSGRGPFSGVLQSVFKPRVGPAQTGVSQVRKSITGGGLASSQAVPNTRVQRGDTKQGGLYEPMKLPQNIPQTGGNAGARPVTEPTLRRSSRRPIRYPQDR